MQEGLDSVQPPVAAEQLFAAADHPSAEQKTGRAVGSWERREEGVLGTCWDGAVAGLGRGAVD